MGAAEASSHILYETESLQRWEQPTQKTASLTMIHGPSYGQQRLYAALLMEKELLTDAPCKEVRTLAFPSTMA